MNRLILNLLTLLGPVAAAVVVGCAGAGSAPPVFVPGPVVDRVRDDAPIPVPPEREFHRISYLIESYSLHQARDLFGQNEFGPARDVNRLGEVPASSWYAGADGRLDADLVRRGPGGEDPGPEAHKPWTVTGVKVGGRNPGFVFRDARGASYICKFDKLGEPVVSTAAGAVAARLFWAVGYHVPDDRVVRFAHGDLAIDPSATIKNSLGEKRPLTAADIDEMLDDLPVARIGDGYRALVSRFLDGRPRGGFALAGTNPDDPNDRIAHQDRRSLRALRVFGAWLNHVDAKEDNTLDIYVGEPDEGHLVHYLVDFDGCLGGYWAARHEQRIGYAYDFDWREFWGGIPELGLRVRPYEDLTAPEHPEVGLFTERAFDPAVWRPNYSNDQILACGPADAFWAGTVLARIDDAMIAAAAEAGRFRDPAAADVLTRVLIERRDLILEWALTSVSPAVNLVSSTGPAAGSFTVNARSALGDAGLRDDLRWRVDARDAEGNLVGIIVQNVGEPAATVPALLLQGRDGVILRWTATDARGDDLPPTDAHYGRLDGAWTLLGITRDGA